MKRKSIRFALSAFFMGLLIFWGVQDVNAALLYDNGSPNQADGNEMTAWIQAEDFNLTAGATITGVRFWDFTYGGSGYNGSITWQIYSDSNGQPGTVLASGNTAAVTRTPTGVNTYFGPEMQDDFSVGSVNLNPGTYWVGLHNGPLTHDSRDELYWETTDINSTTAGNEDAAPFGDKSWYNNGQEHAFELYGNTEQVPEPSIMLLLGAGLAGIGCVRKRIAG